MIAGNASPTFSTSFLSASAKPVWRFFQGPFIFWWRTSCPFASSKDTCNGKENCWKSHWLKIWLCHVHERRYEFFLLKMYFYQEPFQGFVWSLRQVSESIFDSVIVFLTLLVFCYSSRLFYPFITTFVHQIKFKIKIKIIFYFFQLFGISFYALINFC